MRVSILISASCTALLLGALPAAANAGGCPAAAHVGRAVHARSSARVATNEVRPAYGDHRAYAWRSDHDWSQEDVGSWRHDRRDWSDGRWRIAGGPGERDLYRDGGWRGADGFRRETESWSGGRQGWRADWGWAAARPMMTDRFGYLTWPGKTHFFNGQPIDAAPDGPPEGPWQVHP